MGRAARFGAIALLAAGLTGCVERRFLVESNPPGATVLVNGEFRGTTPVSVPFTYYGKYDITLVRDGYETKTYAATIRRPWFEYFPLDFFAEVLYPMHIQDNRRLQFDLSAMSQPRTDDVLNRANGIRQRAAGLGPELMTPDN
jgi:hypothetical protein